MAHRRVRVLVRGRVQGVGFRYFTHSVGRNLGLAGFVANERDGSVTAEAEGDASAVEQFLLQVRQGPAHAVVEQIDIHELPGKGTAAGFTIR